MPTTFLLSVPYSQKPHLVLLWASFKENCQKDRTATLNQTNKTFSIQSGTMARRKCRKAHMDWNILQWYSSTTLPQLPAQGEEAILLNFIIPIWFCFSSCVQTVFEHMWTSSLHSALSQGISMQNYSANKGILSSFFTCLISLVSSFPDYHYYWKRKYLWYLFSTCGGRTKKKTKTDLTVYNNKPVLEEKDNEGWCSPNLKK